MGGHRQDEPEVGGQRRVLPGRALPAGDPGTWWVLPQ